MSTKPTRRLPEREASGAAPADYGHLVEVLSNGQLPLSARLRQVAHYLLNNPEDAAINSIVELARHADVQPSTISRFAKRLGYRGFAELQKVFRQRLVGPRLSYAERLEAVAETAPARRGGELDLKEPGAVFEALAQSAVDSLLRLPGDIDRGDLKSFVKTLHRSRSVHIAAARGAFGLGAYCYYGLSRVGKPAHLIDNLGAMRAEQLLSVQADDALLVMSFDDYTPETVELAVQANRQGRKVLVITDNEMSPIAGLGPHTLYVKEAGLGHFRSQVPAMVLCQSIIVSLGRLMDRGGR